MSAAAATDGNHSIASRLSDRPARVDILFGLAYHPDWRVRKTAAALSEGGYDVRILAWDRDGSLPTRQVDGRVRIERAHVRSRSGRALKQLAYLARVVPKWFRAMRRDPPDVLHAVDLPMLAVALAAKLVLLRRARVVYDAFELYTLMEAHKYPTWLLRVIGWAEARLPRLADLVITPGTARQSYLARRGVESIVVANWTDPPAVPPTRAQGRERLGIRSDAFCIGYAGGLEPSRDVGALVEHARRHPRDVVVIAGRGEQATMCERAARELPNVMFVGWLEDPAIVYTACDAVFYALRPDHPYAAYPAPNNLYAAIAYAVPLVYRPQGELAEVARLSEIGFAFNDQQELSRAVDSLRITSERDRVVQSLRALQAEYTWARASRTLLDRYPAPPGTRRAA